MVFRGLIAFPALIFRQKTAILCTPQRRRTAVPKDAAINMQKIPSQDIMKPDYKNWIPRGLLFTMFGGEKMNL